MVHIVFGLYIFLDILGIIVFIDVILSWLLIFQIRFRPQFIANLMDPLYAFVKKHIPTTIGMIDFTPIVIIFGIYFLKGLLISFFPEIQKMIQIFM